jgi:phosphoribosylaminoimidazole-succinocarboxamide synthase
VSPQAHGALSVEEHSEPAADASRFWPAQTDDHPEAESQTQQLSHFMRSWRNAQAYQRQLWQQSLQLEKLRKRID